jgi:hypothetical protein
MRRPRVASPDKTPQHIIAPIPLTVTWSEGLPHDKNCPGCEVERLEAEVVRLRQEKSPRARDEAFAEIKAELEGRVERLREALEQAATDLMEASEQFDIQGMQKAASRAHQCSVRAADAVELVASPDKPPEPEESDTRNWRGGSKYGRVAGGEDQ